MSTMKKSDKPIVIEEIFSSSLESVWDAITKLDLMHRWYFDNIPNFIPEVGFKTKFDVKSEERNFIHIWEITEVIPLKKIKYIWQFEKYSGKSTADFNLFKADNHTRLRLIVEILDDFPDGIKEFTRESCIAGWKYFINNRLKDFLSKN